MPSLDAIDAQITLAHDTQPTFVRLLARWLRRVLARRALARNRSAIRRELSTLPAIVRKDVSLTFQPYHQSE